MYLLFILGIVRGRNGRYEMMWRLTHQDREGLRSWRRRGTIRAYRSCNLPPSPSISWHPLCHAWQQRTYPVRPYILLVPNRFRLHCKDLSQSSKYLQFSEPRHLRDSRTNPRRNPRDNCASILLNTRHVDVKEIELSHRGR